MCLEVALIQIAHVESLTAMGTPECSNILRGEAGTGARQVVMVKVVVMVRADGPRGGRLRV